MRKSVGHASMFEQAAAGLFEMAYLGSLFRTKSGDAGLTCKAHMNALA